MSEEVQVFSSKISYNGIFLFKDFYKFCHDWLTEEMGLSDLSEDKYSEKLSGNTKAIDAGWSGKKSLSDYFREKVKITISAKNLSRVKLKKGEAEIESNRGSVEVSVKGILVKDYQGRFEMNAFRKFLRGVYEKYIISSTISGMNGKVASDCNGFLEEAKAFLDLEGKTR